MDCLKFLVNILKNSIYTYYVSGPTWLRSQVEDSEVLIPAFKTLAKQIKPIIKGPIEMMPDFMLYYSVRTNPVWNCQRHIDGQTE